MTRRRMEGIIFAVLPLAILRLAAVAQTTVNPPVARAGSQGYSSSRPTPGWTNAPAAATQLIFYGGDVNPSDPNANGWANGNTLLTPNVTTYGAVTTPATGKVVAAGILFNQVPTCNEGPCETLNFDPATGTYDVRTGVAEGLGGTSVASGSGPQTAVATGRIVDFFGNSLPEYSTSVTFTKPLTPSSGTTYFINESPQCTNSGDSECPESQYFFTNTTQQTNGINPTLQPQYQAFINSAFFGYTWANTCDLVGGQSPLCEWQSFGIYGTGNAPQVVFYSGDFDPTNTLANGLLNLNTKGMDGTVWVPFAVKKQLTVNFLFINELFNVPPPASAPATWEISNGVSQGNGGKIQCSGKGTATSAPTGRSFLSYTEYQYTINLKQPCILTATGAENSGGTQVPPPTRGGCPGGCSLGMTIENPPGPSVTLQGFLSDVEDNPPMNHIGLPNILDSSFFSSTAFGFNFQPAAAEQGGACSEGLPVAITNVGCDMFSIGIGGSGQ
jgi:hypothetical protein